MNNTVCILLLIHCLTVSVATTPPESQRELDGYMAQLTEKAHQEGPINPADYGSDHYAQLICQSQALAEEGEFSSALNTLRSVDIYQFTARKREVIESRIKTFEKLTDPNLPFLESYTDFVKYTCSDWFEDRLTPIIYIWERDFPILEKYRFLEAAFWRLDSAKGLALVLEATADLPQLNQQESARTLLRLGSVYRRYDNFKQAEKTWLRILSDYSKELSDWHATAYYLGGLEEEKNNPEKALGYYEMVIQSPAADKEPVTNFFDYTSIIGWKHEASLAASYIYQSQMRYFKALRYTIDAKFKYPYESWCGTCLQARSVRLYLRIVFLSLIVFGVPVIFILVIGWLYKRRRKNTS